MIPVLGQILPAIGQVVGGGVQAIGGAIAQVARGGTQAIGGLIGSGANLIGQTAGGIGQVVKTADWEGIAKVAGAGYGIYTSIEANKLAKKQLDIYEKALGRQPTPGGYVPMATSFPSISDIIRSRSAPMEGDGDSVYDPISPKLDQQQIIYYALLALLGLAAVKMLERG